MPDGIRIRAEGGNEVKRVFVRLLKLHDIPEGSCHHAMDDDPLFDPADIIIFGPQFLVGRILY